MIPFSFAQNGVMGTKYHLPYRRRLDYIESTGTQYIDTGYRIPEEGCTIEIDASFENCASKATPFFAGQRDNEPAPNPLIGFVDVVLEETNGVRKSYGYLARKPVLYGDVDKNKHTFKSVLFKISDSYYLKCSLDGRAETQSSASSVSYRSDRTITIFGNHYAAGIQANTAGVKIYGFRISGIMDLIPVLDLDNTPCMYDKISKRFFYNAGTGEFKYRSYTKLDYLESTGTQWIDTGEKLSSNSKVELQFYSPVQTTSGVQGVFGFIDRSNVSSVALVLTPTNVWRAHFGDKDTWIDADAVKKIVIDGGKFYFNDVQKWNYSAEFSGTNPAAIFARADTIAYTLGSYKLASCRIWQNGVLVKDFIPVLDSNNVACLYDKETKEYFYNKGTGEFLCNRTDAERQLAYLESTGTQYIDTNININSRYSWKVTFAEPLTTSTAGQRALLGTRNASYNASNVFFQNVSAGSGSRFDYDGGGIVTPAYSAQTYNIIEFRVTGDVATLKINGTASGTKAVVDFAPTKTFLIFNAYLTSAGARSVSALCKISSFQLWDDSGDLVFDGIPMLRNTDFKPAMYDRISKTYFVNANTTDTTEFGYAFKL